MAGYQHILVAADLRTKHANVINKAVELRDAYQAKLSLVHVIEMIPSYMDVYGYFSSTDLFTKMKKDFTQTLESVGKRIHVDKANQYICEGTPSVEVIALAEKLNVDLIIIGAHTHTAFERLLGSTSNGVVHTAKCDVLIVRYPH